MHACAHKTAHRRSAAAAQPQHDNNAAGLVFAQKAARLAADDEHRLLFPVRLHMDARTVARVAPHVDFPAAHGVAGGITGRTMHEDRAVIHGIAGGVLRVAQHRDARAVQICAQRVSGRACQRQLFLSKARRNIALAVHMLHGQRRVRAFPDARAKLLCWHVFRVKLCHHTSPPSCTLRSFWENAMSCGDSRIRSKSISDSGFFLRMRSV